VAGRVQLCVRVTASIRGRLFGGDVNATTGWVDQIDGRERALSVDTGDAASWFWRKLTRVHARSGPTAA